MALNQDEKMENKTERPGRRHSEPRSAALEAHTTAQGLVGTRGLGHP